MARARSRGKAPNLGDLGTVAEMGWIKEVVVEVPNGEHHRYLWSPQAHLLLWAPRQRSLVWVEGTKPSRLRDGAPRTDGAAKIFEAFSDGQPAEQHRTLVVPPKRMRKIGRAISIDYREPWGRAPDTDRWFHDFAPSDAFYMAGRSAPFAFAVSGPRLTVTEAGIVY